MTLREVPGVAGAPWEREIRGRFDRLVVESNILAGNPLGDPARRPLYVYLPPGVGEGDGESLCSIYVIQGFTGQLDAWLNRSPLEPNMVERIDELFSGSSVPPAVVVFVDAWTSVGGSQFINSGGTGRYMDYLCDEVVAFVDDRYPTAVAPEHRGLTGKSSGGYGAMVVPMLRPDVFGGLASHAGDALFESCYLPEFPGVVRALRDRFEGSYDVFWERFRTAERFDWETFGGPFETYGYAMAYSPDEAPRRALLPFDERTGKLNEDVWERWLEWDPVRMAPKHLDALASMKRIYLDAGASDEYYLDLGAQAFSRELEKGGIEHSLELFDGKHGGLQYRYPGAIAELAQALSP
ncbi:MAG: alpha/beta hydrolase-fold protein [Actinomycetota bacterium]|nr:alpha/beta hydrolase-fold protein [Actinomycetota bacterium]